MVLPVSCTEMCVVQACLHTVAVLCVCVGGGGVKAPHVCRLVLSVYALV